MIFRRLYLNTGIWTLGLAGWLVLGISASAQTTYIEPGGVAPGGSVASPLNSTDSAQRKSGSLIIGTDGGTTSKLCLNADPVQGTNDADNCINSWSQFIDILGGPFVILRQSALLSANAMTIDAYQREAGYARIVSTVGQVFSAVIQAEQICNFASGFCRTDGSACSSNNDCRGGLSTVSTGLYASDAGIVSNDAAVFGGRVLVDRNSRYSLSSDPLDLGRLCLNDTAGPSCVSSWDTLAQPAFGYVKLQGITLAEAINPAEKQIGNAAVTGVGQISAIIAGDPNVVGGTLCGGRPCICGDGQCQASQENTANCPVDCATVNPLSQFVAAHQGSFVGFTVQTSAQSPAGNVHLLIVRSTNQPLSFTPQFGRLYSSGMTVGNTKVVYSANVPQSSVIAVPNDTSINPGETYYYAGYQANQFPRYASPQSHDTRRILTFSKNLLNVASVVDTKGTFECDFPCTFKTAAYAQDEVVTLIIDHSDGCVEFVGWSGACTGKNELCTFVMNFDQTVNASFIFPLEPCGGGGGGTQ